MIIGNNICHITKSGVSLSLRSLMMVCAINTALMDVSKANALCLALKWKSVVYTSIQTLSERKAIVTAPDRSVSLEEWEAK